jgi:prepilin-type N-terminal cleavage/methylation domain-containing protein
MTLTRIKYESRRNGYTLIELLLVVTILALIAAVGVKAYRDKAQSDRVNIAALNIQHVLESGMAYNVANKGLWPKSNWTNKCVSSQTDDFVQNYLPNEATQSNFGTPLCWSGDAKPGDQSAKRFWAAIKIPGNDPTTVSNTAKRIAARLPNAVITNDPSIESSGTAPSNTCGAGDCYIKAAVSVPSASSTALLKTYVAGMGYCNGDSIDSPSLYAHGVQQPGWSTDVYCIRRTLGQQFPTKAGAYANDDSLGQYEIHFTCKPGETGSVYATPNDLQVERYKNTQTSPLYQLIMANNARQDSSGNTIPDCDITSDGQAMCVVTIRATFGAESSGVATDVGCTDNYQKLLICNCPEAYGQGNSCQGSKNDEPGFVGASYIAVCSSSTAPNNSVSNNAHSFW